MKSKEQVEIFLVPRANHSPQVIKAAEAIITLLNSGIAFLNNLKSNLVFNIVTIIIFFTWE